MRVTQTRTFQELGEASLTPGARVLLQRIGAALDDQRPLLVHAHGLVALGESATAAKENGNERQGKERSTTRSRQRASSRKRPAGGSRASGAAPRLGGDGLRSAYEAQLTALEAAYPTLRVFPDDKGMWLTARSSIFECSTREATFLVALPFQSDAGPRTWGFWTSAAGPKWIGPRHTNFGDGSICAFSPLDRAWSEGADLRTLLDLYSVWVLRHLHLEIFSRWPGKQYALGNDPKVQAYYRQRQCRDDELCGCGSESRRYAECHKLLDLEWNFVELATVFGRQYPGGFASRQPPAAIVNFMEGRSALPRMAEVHRGIA